MGEHVCDVCKDTHRMPLSERLVSCTHCPVPCSRCRAGGNGAYCAEPWCECECHGDRIRSARGWLARSLASASAEVATWPEHRREAMRVLSGGERACISCDAPNPTTRLYYCDACWPLQAKGLFERDLERQLSTAEREITRLRDQLGVERHRSALVRDVLRAADGQLTDESRPGHRPASGITFAEAVDRWRAAGRPGLVSDG